MGLIDGAIDRNIHTDEHDLGFCHYCFEMN